MNLTINTELPLFQSSVVITGIEQTDSRVTITGREISGDEIDKTKWNVGEFGFVTSEVGSLDLFERMLEIAKVIRFARSSNKLVEFLFRVENTCLVIYWREKPTAF